MGGNARWSKEERQTRHATMDISPAIGILGEGNVLQQIPGGSPAPPAVSGDDVRG